MAGTYTKIYAHVIFSVKGRQKLIKKSFKEELNKYITGIIINKGQKLLRINGTNDHIHILVGYKPVIALSELVRDIKANSSKFINDKCLTPGKFEWQDGFGGFSCGHRELKGIIKYIDNQEEHHKKKTFQEEYIQFLKDYDVDYKEEYIFD